MRAFIRKILIFLIPALVWLLIEGSLPSEAFTNRPWDALYYRFMFGFGAEFHQNQSVNIESVGDLCRNTEFAVKRKEKWITDKLGYRNDKFISNPDIVVIGDSFMAGTGITQDSTFVNLLRTELGNKYSVYNISPGDFYDYIYFHEIKGILSKPKLIIFSNVERDLPEPIIPPKSKAATLNFLRSTFSGIPGFGVFVDKSVRLYSLKFMKSKLRNDEGIGVQGVNNSTIFFLNGAKQNYLYEHLGIIAERINSYKEYCDKNGISFIYLPLPNKETIYYEKVRFDKQPDFIPRLYQIMVKDSVPTINTVELLTNSRGNFVEELYYTDDTHWSPSGALVVVKAVTDVIHKQNILR